ncbi:hypothetical protein QQ045_013603 [Rhodiola kirilowii]
MGSKMVIFVLLMMMLAQAQFSVVQSRPMMSTLAPSLPPVATEVASFNGVGLQDMVRSFAYRLASGPSRRGPGH